jgi:hypothetical protein
MDNIHNISNPYKIDQIRYSIPNDAFGRLRVSEPYTLFDSQSRYFQNDLNWYSNIYPGTSGSAVTYNPNTSTVYLSPGSNPTAGITRETRYIFPYQPGKSLLIMMSFCMAPQDPNVVQRIGYYGQKNGIYFECSDQYYIVKRNNGVETRIPQTQWNGATLINILNVQNVQLFWTDIEWLGVGSVRCGFILDSQFMICHTFRAANYIDSTYMGTACLPCRYEIFNTGSPSVTGSMQQICTTIMSEGGYQPGVSLVNNIQNHNLTLPTSGTVYPFISIRLNTNYLDGIVRLSKILVLSTKNTNITWSLTRNATLTGSNFINHSTSTFVQYDISATSMTGGTIINSGLCQNQASDQYDITSVVYQLGRSLGVSDIFTLSGVSDANNGQVLSMLAWVQI